MTQIRPFNYTYASLGQGVNTATASTPQALEAPEHPTSSSPKRLHFSPADLPRLYLPGGLLEGEKAPGLTGQARRLAAQDETLAWSRGLIYRYDTVKRSTGQDPLHRLWDDPTAPPSAPLLDVFL